MRTAVLFLLVSGCGFHAVGNGDGGPDDMSVSSADDLGDNADLTGIPPGSDLSLPMGGACAAPQLLIGVENLHNGDSGGGRVARFALAAGGQTQCATLTGQGLIGAQPLAVAGDLDGIGAATIDGLYLVDAKSDTVKWSKPAPQVQGWLPLDAFSILTPQGAPVIAVAYGPAGSTPNTIAEIDAFDGSGANEPMTMWPWCIQGTNCTTLPLGLGILSVSATPTDLTHFIALDYSTPAAAWDVDPWTQTKTPYLGMYTDQLASVYAVVSGKNARFAWLDQTMAAGAIEYATDSGGGPSTLGGPVKCASGCATLLHVVPDPTTSDGYFALCDGPTVDARTVVRIDGSLACTQILDGKTFGAESRLSRLGILQ